MPAPAIVGAVVAVGFAAEATTTAVMAFSIAAAIGSAAAAVGQITGSKELTIAGTVLGAVGAVGGLASSAGLLGEAGSFFGMGGPTGATNVAGGAVADVTSAAAGEVTAAAAPVGGYTWSAVQASDPSLATIPSDVISKAGGGTSNIVDTIAGTVAQTPLAEAPAIAQGATVEASPAAAVNDVVNADALVPNPTADVVNPESLVPDPAGGLIDQTGGTSMADVGTDMNLAAADPSAGLPVDANGNVIAQGDGGMPGSPAGSMDGPDPTVTGGNDQTGLINQPDPAAAAQPTGQQVTGTTSPQPNAGTTPGSTADPSSVGRQILAGGKPVTIGANPGLDAGIPGSFDLTRATLANTPPAPVDGGSAWGGIWDFTKKNPLLLMGGLSAATSFLSGAMSPLSGSQARALDTQAQQNLAAANLANAQAEMLQRRMANMRQGIPQAQWKSQAGMINTPVTGAPA